MYCVIFNNYGDVYTTTFDTEKEVICYIEGVRLNGVDVMLDDFVVVKGSVVGLRPARVGSNLVEFR